MKLEDTIQGVTPKADAEAMLDSEKNKEAAEKAFKGRMVKPMRSKEEVNTKLELDESLFRDAHLAEAKKNQAEDQEKDMYTYVYDCLFEGTHNAIPGFVRRRDRFTEDRFTAKLGEYDIGVKVESDEDKQKVRRVADTLFLPIEETSDAIYIKLNAATASMMVDEFLEEMELPKTLDYVTGGAKA